MKSKFSLRQLTTCSVMIALATVLSFIKIYEAPLGGAVTLFSMTPIIMVALIYGTKTGLATAFVYSAIQLIIGFNNVLWIPNAVGIVLCILFDYIVAFSATGLADIYSKTKWNTIVKTIAGTLTVCIIRFASHVFVGAVVWYSLTKEGQWNEVVNQFGLWTYSLVYNGSFMLPETVITVIATTLLIIPVMRIMKIEKK